MRKGMALALAGIVAASLAAGVALLGGRVDTAAAAGTAEPTVITEHRKVIIYKTETLAPETIVVESSEDEDEYEEAEATESPEPTAVGSAAPTSGPVASPSPTSGSSDHSDDHLGTGTGDGHDD